MSRNAFLNTLRANLKGVTPQAADEIVADYASHFDEGAAEGRSEEDIAAGLGDPVRLARELSAEAGLNRWDQERSVAAGVAAVFALLSLGAIDVLILIPILIAVYSVLFAFTCVAAALMVVGVIMLIVSPLAVFGGGFVACLLGGMGLLSAGLCLGALMTLAAIGLTNLLIRYGRFHLRLIKPITE